jgi:tetratricopeptide (TPR) repeat protein
LLSPFSGSGVECRIALVPENVMSRLPLVVAVLVLLAAPVLAGAEDAAKLAAEGETLLAEGNLKEAYRRYAAAAKADPANDEIRQQALLLRRILVLRTHVARAEPSPAWERQVASLHYWYLHHGLVEMAVEGDRAAHAKAKSAGTAFLLADALLRAERAEEVESVLGAIPDEDLPGPHRLMLAIAQARLGKKDAARRSVEKSEVPEEPGPGSRLLLARIHVLLGETDAGLAQIEAVLEQTPPSRRDAVLADVRANPDLASLAGTKPFEEVLATPSKVKESDCSSGSDCGSCPSRSKCGGGK